MLNLDMKNRTADNSTKNHIDCTTNLGRQLRVSFKIFLLSLPVILLLTQQSSSAQLIPGSNDSSTFSAPSTSNKSSVQSPTGSSNTTARPAGSTTTTAKPAGADSNKLRVDVLLFGIKNNTGNIVTFVTARNFTEAFAGNAYNLDKADNSTDGIGEVFLSFPQFNAKVGDQFQACNVVVKDLSIKCASGFKSPLNKTETAQILLSSTTPNSIKK
jgi:hypothetical protein